MPAARPYGVRVGGGETMGFIEGSSGLESGWVTTVRETDPPQPRYQDYRSDPLIPTL